MSKSDVPFVTRALEQWYPDVVIGSESHHLTEDFYYRNVQLARADEERDTLGLVLRFEGTIVGLMMLTKDAQSQSVTSRMGALAPEHRRGAVGFLGVLLLDAAARAMGAGVAYSFVTMKTRHQQVIAERYGFQIVGIMPAWDVDMIEPNRPKRVFEAIYAKVYAPRSEWHLPPPEAMTKRTRELWNFLFPQPD
ncbi:hypothetical protein LVJ94_38565 [Pendulispora rubella]|uniref:N-acetyltransferase domain-containing protein n=1 Tax=Pendulispora rubella TaxID=2741070 RepID=A0ABZ2KZR6_9BACT